MINVRKHAEATLVGVAVSGERGGLQLMVSDDGRGLDPEQIASSHRPGHRGIVWMRDQVSAAGGALEVESEGRGTRVTIWLPLD